MNCFECAKANDTVPAVGVCQHCNVGLCLDHLIEASEYRGRRDHVRLPASRSRGSSRCAASPPASPPPARHHTAGVS